MSSWRHYLRLYNDVHVNVYEEKKYSGHSSYAKGSLSSCLSLKKYLSFHIEWI